MLPKSSRLSSLSLRMVLCLAVFSSALTLAFNLLIESSAKVKSVAPPAPVRSQAKMFDFDGDGMDDIGRWQASSQQFLVKEIDSGSYLNYAIGSPTAKAAPGDYDGDGKTDAAVFESATGTWTYKTAPSATAQTISHGQLGDIPVALDYDGDHTTDAAVFRPSDGTWRIKQSSDGTVQTTTFGQSGDIPIPGRFGERGELRFAVFRPSNGSWHILDGPPSLVGLVWGSPSDIPITSDFDGDFVSDVCLFSPADGGWTVLQSSLDYSDAKRDVLHLGWGNYGDQPLPADYDGDDKADFAAWRPTTGTWHILKSSDSKYDVRALGVPGDLAVPSAYLRQAGTVVYGDSLGAARLSPKNASGSTNLYSQNFSWAAPLVSLPGRSGHDLGVGISYNSLIWLKDPTTNQVVFDPDRSNVAPGFRFGPPILETRYYDNLKDKDSIILVMPSGQRVQFLQKQASDYYESTDSTFTQLRRVDPNEYPPPWPLDGEETPDLAPIIVTGANGSQMTFHMRGGSYKCVQIVDRNGNRIALDYSELGLLDKMTDTLGREVEFTYDEFLYPKKITQKWKDNNGQGSEVTRTYATFHYSVASINTNFSGNPTIVGPPNGTSLKVLSNIVYGDGSQTHFEYNNYGQVKKVNNLAADAHLLSSVSNGLDVVTGQQSDSPRFSSLSEVTENLNGNIPVVTNMSRANGQSVTLNGRTITGTQIDVMTTNHPTPGYFTRAFFGDSGVFEGLPLATLDCMSNCTGANLMRWTWTDWDNGEGEQGWPVAYQHNPRVNESQLGDGPNIKGTKIYYYDEQHPTTGQTIHPFAMPETVDTYSGGFANVVGRSVTQYHRPCIPPDLPAVCGNYQQIGLATSRQAWGWNSQTSMLELASHLTYGYDQAQLIYIPTVGLTDEPHPGRGHLTSVTRHNVATANDSVTIQLRYNYNGSIISKTDPMNRMTTISYADSYNDGINRYTNAYPTTITNPAGNASQIKYRFDIGANVWAKGPDLDAATQGKETTREYDSYGRLWKDTIINNGAYTRYSYGNNGTSVASHSTLINSNEFVREIQTDGAGRVLQARSAHPGSDGGWSATKNKYDILGRTISQSVPTEVDINWEPAGVDSGPWKTNTIEYDWKGRPAQTTNTDGTFKKMSYEGCGCAGGEIVTVEGETVPRHDIAGSGKRKQKSYSDPLGRVYKTETLDWDGNVYTSSLFQFNGRGQTLSDRSYSGPAVGTNFQETSAGYDGHGRLSSYHRPGQSGSTGYSYFADDKLQSTVDANGARETYIYNNRGLVTRKDFDLTSPQNIDALTPVIHRLDNGGATNRYYVTIRGNNFGTDPKIVVDTSGGSPGVSEAIYEGSQLIRSESNGDQYISFLLTGSVEQYRLINPPGIGVTVKNTPSNKQSSKAWIRVVVPNVLQGHSNPEYTYSWDITSTSIIPEAILPVSSVLYEYDNAGNVILMTDGLGAQAFEYDSLSRLKSETRDFNDELPSAVTPPNGFRLQYQYHLMGQIKKVTDPFGEEISYGYDGAGRLTGVSGLQGSTQANLQYVTAADYRAFGAMKKVVYGNSISLETDYDGRLRPSKTSFRDLSSSNVSEFHYQYNADDKLKFSNETGHFPGKEGNPLDRFDRSFDYDFVGRMTLAKTGAEARGQTETDFTKRPYRTSYSWDAFDHLAEVDKFHWTESYPDTPITFVNDREQPITTPPSPYPPHTSSVITPLYDFEGRKIGTNYATSGTSGGSNWNIWDMTFNAAGNRVRDRQRKYSHDGRGNILKTSSESVPRIVYGFGRIEIEKKTTYSIFSSVLGEVINEVNVASIDWWRTSGSSSGQVYFHWDGSSKASNVYAWGTRVGRTDGVVTQTSTENANGTFYQEKTLGVAPGIPNPQLYNTTNSLELDPFGASVGEVNPYPTPGQPPNDDDGCGGTVWEDGEWGDEPPCDEMGDPMDDEDAGIGNVAENTCYINGFEADCEEATNHPDTYEEDPGDIGVATFTDGSRRFVLRNYGTGGWMVPGQNGRPTLKKVSREERVRRRLERERRGTETDSLERDYIPFDVTRIREGVGAVWQNSDCRNLITGMLNAVSSRGNPVESNGNLVTLFDRMMEGTGGLSRRPPPNGRIRGGSVSGSFRGNNATVHSPANNEYSTIHQQLVSDIHTVVDELMHLAGRNQVYSDRAFARVVQQNPQWASSNWQDNFFQIPQTYPDDVPDLTREQKQLLERDNVPYSAYWHPVIYNLCLSKVDFGGL